MDYVIGNNKDDNIKVIIVTGACRSGKTIISKLLGSMANIEWIEEPYNLMILPLMEHLSLIKRGAANNLIRANVKELFNDNILLRNGNFRPKDLSSIWSVKEPEVIFNRLNDLNSRDDVQVFIKKNKSMILIDLPEVHPFIDIFFESFSNIKVIHVVRNGLKVACNIELKKWYTEEQLKNSQHNIMVYAYHDTNSGKDYRLPWWVAEEDASIFVEANEFSKGLYYWSRMMSYNEFYKKEKGYNNYKIVKYEDLVTEPFKVIDDLIEFIDTKKTNLTDGLLKKIHQDELEPADYVDISDLGKDIISNLNIVMKNYGYKL